MGIGFFLQNIGLGAGLAMDAFSVSMANGLNEPRMKRGKHIGIAALFAFFQGLMPMIGWICVYTIAETFEAVTPFIPWVALALLAFIGGKMLFDGIKECRGGDCEEEEKPTRTGFGGLVVQGIATSIDALSVGFTIAEYGLFEALVAVLIIAALTFAICFAGVWIGKKFGTRLAGRATILGGAILILIGVWIFINGTGLWDKFLDAVASLFH